MKKQNNALGKVDDKTLFSELPKSKSDSPL
jgi:hypothetical protein